jgi:ParB-like nuclease domain
VSLDLRDLSVTAIRANPWNPNTTTEEMREALRESLQDHGFVAPITVRPHPTTPGLFEIVNGEHRWRAAIEEGIDTVPAVVLDLPDTLAKKLTVILNEGGEPDLARLARLVAEFEVELGEEFRRGLHYSDAEMNHLRQIAAIDWESLRRLSDETYRIKSWTSDEEWLTITADVPREFVEGEWHEVTEALRAQGVHHKSATVELGLMLEALAAEWLAGARA